MTATVASLMSLKGRRALLTGATGGLGRAMASTLAELGAELILVDRPGTDYAPLLERLERAGGCRSVVMDCDLEQQDDRQRLIAAVRELPGGVNILINNAAFVGTSSLAGWATSFEQQSVETWRRALEVNLTAAFELSQGLAPSLAACPGAAIINIASIYGSYGPDHRLYEGTTMANPAAYAASKGGLIQLTRWLATTLSPRVRVNAIAPGGVLRGQPALFVDRYIERTPLGRMATEDDVKGAVAYLASDLSAYVTGHVLAVDGGWGIW